jgi:hypothetical protein
MATKNDIHTATKEEIDRFMEYHRKRGEEDARHELEAVKKAAEAQPKMVRTGFTTEEMWECNDPVTGFDIDVPSWIDQDISPYDVAAICQGGCASGAYMPAVTYHTARETMNEHGDNVLQYIEDSYGELPQPPADTSWDGRACFFMSVAVELWASMAESELGSWEAA